MKFGDNDCTSREKIPKFHNKLPYKLLYKLLYCTRTKTLSLISCILQIIDKENFYNYQKITNC